MDIGLGIELDGAQKEYVSNPICKWSTLFHPIEVFLYFFYIDDKIIYNINIQIHSFLCSKWSNTIELLIKISAVLKQLLDTSLMKTRYSFTANTDFPSANN